MRRLLLLAILVSPACRQALGIPENASIEQFSIGGRITGVTGVTGGTARLALNGEELSVTEDGEFTFDGRRDDGIEYTVTSESCTIVNGSGIIAGESITNLEVTCDGVQSLSTLGLSAPLELDPAFAPHITSYAVKGSILAQQTEIVPAFAYPDGMIVDIEFDGGVPRDRPGGGYGPELIDQSAMLTITVDNTATAFPERTYTATISKADPLLFGFGKAAQPATSDRLGSSLAAFGDVMVAGLPDRPGGGAAIVFRRTGRGWQEEAVLVPPDPALRFGASVAVSATRIVIGAPGDASRPGAAYELAASGTTWTFVVKRQAPVPANGDSFGAALAIAEAALVVGAPGGDTTLGAAYVFDGAGTRTLAPAAQDPGDRFGASVAIATAMPARVVVGAPGEDSSSATGDDEYPGAGAAYVFDGSAESYLKLAAPSSGDAFGSAVAINGAGTTLVVGAPHEDSSLAGVDASKPIDEGVQGSGAVAIFELTGGAWLQSHFIKPPTAAVNDNFGGALSLVQDVLAIAAPYRNDDALDSGTVYVYPLVLGGAGSLSPTTEPRIVKADNPGDNDAFGSSLALTTESLVVGAPCEDSASSGWNGNQGDGAIDTGAIYTFR